MSFETRAFEQFGTVLEHTAKATGIETQLFGTQSLALANVLIQ